MISVREVVIAVLVFCLVVSIAVFLVMYIKTIVWLIDDAKTVEDYDYGKDRES